MWEEELHAVLRPSFVELCRLFVYYCNTPPQGEADLSPPPPEVHARRSRMSSPHWLALAHDLRLGDALKLVRSPRTNACYLYPHPYPWPNPRPTPTRTRAPNPNPLPLYPCPLPPAPTLILSLFGTTLARLQSITPHPSLQGPE